MKANGPGKQRRMKMLLRTTFPSPCWLLQSSVCWLDTLFLVLCYGPSYLPTSPRFIFWSLNPVLKGFEGWKHVKMRLWESPGWWDRVLKRSDLSTHRVTRMHAYVWRLDHGRTQRGGGRLQTKEMFWSRTFHIQMCGAICFGLNYQSSISFGQPPCPVWLGSWNLR